MKGFFTQNVTSLPACRKEKKRKSPDRKKTVLKYVRTTPAANAPVKGSARSAGFDLKSIDDCIIPARDRNIVNTGLKIQVFNSTITPFVMVELQSRSGLAINNFIDVGAGVVDEDYRGIVQIVLFNHSENDFIIKRGDRIAQLICEKIFYPEVQEVQSICDTERGEGSFGSTGI
ncbi:probable deoxyuridine 5'-triphosphate nucleotidohydrolase [Sitophilus oryzae]|uniref:Deoxyuridine 5'-triphosphate nucleotidohydrolase n=1 Tax=Sitophilus oryzae TaxID=7048 RepID=A0A6J2YMQ3_SITOR|nr:probable deoxyuridine 5'-triphosphate nucleotidohydrolase [Sitophilus oryzae]